MKSDSPSGLVTDINFLVMAFDSLTSGMPLLIIVHKLSLWMLDLPMADLPVLDYLKSSFAARPAM
jgi:hypothetical protein